MKSNASNGDAARRRVWAAIAALILLVVAIELVIYLLSYSRQGVGISLNRLIVGSGAPQAIAVRQVVSQARLSRAELERIRAAALTDYPGLTAGPYRTTKPVFGLVGDDKPWWSLAGFYYFGKQPKMFDGPPAEGEGLANPLILIRPVFTGLSIWSKDGLSWNKALISEGMLRDDFPFCPRAGSINWVPAESLGEVSYNVSWYIAKVNELAARPLRNEMTSFTIQEYNALDFGFTFLALARQESSNITPVHFPNKPIIAIGMCKFDEKACGNSEGCNICVNTLSQKSALKVEAFPARAMFYLWRSRPKAPDAPPDFKFAINIE